MSKTPLLLLTLAALGTTPALAETRAVIDTNLGAITVSLDEKKAPQTVANFSQYARKGFYNGTVFHRVIDGFMIQGGGFTADMAQKATEAPIANEADNGLKNRKYTIAMARTAAPHSASSQFFINVADNSFLDHKDKSAQGWGYAVFGKVTDGQAVVDKIAKVPTAHRGMHQNVPQQPVIIRSVRILK
ncbi:cyclophilin family peptidyl-prolyl cis-trans isomerase [Neisseria sp. HSC-16F19]|nr:peptidylprolyl isomerase [Neisseria sp. HSC-16F19]MCP2039732.1 cyclophilin family peptidyl-prolyl cis-trans isomerase [Neisseria sp. HSC-16F19]